MFSYAILDRGFARAKLLNGDRSKEADDAFYAGWNAGEEFHRREREYELFQRWARTNSVSAFRVRFKDC